MEETGFFDTGDSKILPTSLVKYSDPERKVEDGEGYIVKNLLGVWEVRNVSEQTGTDLSNTTKLQVIGTR